MNIDRSTNLKSVPGDGPFDPDFVVVGKAPTSTASPMGSLSRRIISSALPEKSIYYTNLSHEVWPVKKKLPIKQVRLCIEPLVAELKEVIGLDTFRILVLDPETATVLCPGFKNMRADHGTIFYNPELDIEVVPTFHFSKVATQPQLKAYIKRDLERLGSPNLAEGASYTMWSDVNVKADPTGKSMVVDIETTGLDIFEDDILQVGMALGDIRYIAHPPFNWDELYDYISHSGSITGHNLVFDLAFLERESGQPFTKLKAHDTMLHAKVLGEEVLSLKHLTTLYTNRKGPNGAGGFDDPAYLAEDLASTAALWEYFSPRSTQAWISGLLDELVPYAAEMRLRGVHLSAAIAKEIVDEFQAERDNALLELTQVADILWTSTQQVVPVMLEQGVPLFMKTDKGAYSLSKNALANIDHPLVKLYQQFNELDDTLGFLQTYAENTGRDGYLHPTMKLAGTRTGRLSMANPNLQGVKRAGPIKTMFTSRFEGGSIGLVDLDQAELRVAALESNDRAFMAALLEEDVHRAIASLCFQLPPAEISSLQRKKSKAITFGLLYGGSTSGLATRANISETEVEEVLKAFYGKFPKLAKYLEHSKTKAIMTGQVVTQLGRIRDLHALIEEEGASSAERKAVNTPIQGTASDIALIILLHCFRECRRLNLQSFPIFGVHDSGLLDIHPDEIETMKSIVQEGFLSMNDTPLADYTLWSELPLTGELILGPSWASVESTNEYYAPTGSQLCSTHGG